MDFTKEEKETMRRALLAERIELRAKIKSNDFRPFMKEQYEKRLAENMALRNKIFQPAQ